MNTRAALRLLFVLLIGAAINVALAQPATNTITFRTGDGVQRGDFNKTVPNAWTFSTANGQNCTLGGSCAISAAVWAPLASKFGAL